MDALTAGEVGGKGMGEGRGGEEEERRREGGKE